MKQAKILTAADAGYTMKCVASCNDKWFTVGKSYKTLVCDFEFVGEGCPSIADNDGTTWALNWQQVTRYGIEGSKVVAKFIMIKDGNGKFVPHDTMNDMMERPSGNIDYRRARRFLRNCNKFNPHKLLRKMARNEGK